VLASDWTASDVYTMVLWEHFCHHLPDGQAEGSALQQTKLDLIKGFSTEAVPFCRAGFNLVGDASTAVLRPAK
jgi:CHAT domain-containing protein